MYKSPLGFNKCAHAKFQIVAVVIVIVIVASIFAVLTAELLP